MSSELTNLLPRLKVKAFRRQYFVRLATVATVLLVLLFIVQGIFLIPSYLYVSEEERTASAALDHAAKTSTTAQAQQAQLELSNLNYEATTLTQLASTTEASATIRTILTVPRPGISLNGFTFAPATAGVATSVEISGIAVTREQLSSYDQALGALPGVTNANLPISDYAKESDIPFTITLTGAPTS